MVGRRRKTVKRRVKRRKRQRGGAAFRRKARLVDKIAEGMAMGLSGPAPTFLSLAGKLGSQGLKGITDNVKYYRRRR